MDGRADGDLMETEKDHEEVAWVDPGGWLLLQNHVAGEEAQGLLLLRMPHPGSSDPTAAVIHGALTHGQELKVSPQLSSLSLPSLSF